jgi:hypothetical protein
MDNYINKEYNNPINTKEKDFVAICENCGSEKEYNKEKGGEICNDCQKCEYCNNLLENCDCLPF